MKTLLSLSCVFLIGDSASRAQTTTIQITGLQVYLTSSTTLTITEGTSRISGVAYTPGGRGVITISSGTPTVRVYVSDGTDGAPIGSLKVRNSAASGVSCNSYCTLENSQSS